MRVHWLVLTLAACLAMAARAEPVEYLLDPAHTWVHAELKHFGTSTIRARFGPVAGSVTLDRDTGRGALDVRIDTASVSTGLRVFDGRVREADLLASAEFPQARFVAERFVLDAGRLVEIQGEFTLRGVRRPLTLRALRFACDERALLQREVCGGDFEAWIDRSAFGASYGLLVVADRVRLVIQAEGVRREGPAAPATAGRPVD